jgi:hypothetical protein
MDDVIGERERVEAGCLGGAGDVAIVIERAEGKGGDEFHSDFSS